jgi:hypothetical protein
VGCAEPADVVAHDTVMCRYLIGWDVDALTIIIRGECHDAGLKHGGLQG